MSTFYVNLLSNHDSTAVVTWFVMWFRLSLSRALYGPKKAVCTAWVAAQVLQARYLAEMELCSL